MALLGKNDILKADDRRYETLTVPEWGGEVRICSLSGAERDRWEASLAKIGKDGQPKPDLINMRARLVAIAIVDEEGRRVFSDSDVLALGGKSSRALQRVFEAASELSGIEEDAVEKVKEDFGSAQNESSTSD